MLESAETSNRHTPEELWNTQQELKETVFQNAAEHFTDHAWLCQTAILVPTNQSVNIINNILLQELPGTLQVYKSIDTTCDENEAVNYTPEFLNTLNPPGIPSHVLELKIGAPIVLLRNLHPPTLFNGTQLCQETNAEYCWCDHHDWTNCKQRLFIPIRIPLIPSNLPFQLKRPQFSVRLSFAMSINKAQGQSQKSC